MLIQKKNMVYIYNLFGVKMKVNPRDVDLLLDDYYDDELEEFDNPRFKKIKPVESKEKTKKHHQKDDENLDD